MQITFVTGNKEKYREVSEILGSTIEVVNKDFDLQEIQEIDSLKIAIDKAQSAYKLLKLPLFVEDTSLYIKTWNGLPGSLNKWFMKTVGNEGIVRMLTDFDDRSAKAETIIAYHDGVSVKIFVGTTEGNISKEIKGKNGFGWDKIFIMKGRNKTNAELDPLEKNQNFCRSKAVLKFKKYLDKLNE